MRETYTPPPEKPSMYGDQAAEIFLKSLQPGSKILDIGGGDDDNRFRTMCEKAGHTYQNLDWRNGDDWESPNLRASMIGAFDGVWMCHSLEHMLDTHSALTKVLRVLKPRGVFAVTVPPRKDKIVGGHVVLFNLGLLVYRLILAGFDCSKAAVKGYGYNCSVVVRRSPVPLDLPSLKRDNGDITKLAHLFPSPIGEAFNGHEGYGPHNWGPV